MSSMPLVPPIPPVPEARLDELLDDPLIRQVMARDGVCRDTLAALMRRTVPLTRMVRAAHRYPLAPSTLTPH